MVSASPERNFPIRKFAYHLPKPQTDRFAHVNGKQAEFPLYFRFYLVQLALANQNKHTVSNQPKARSNLAACGACFSSLGTGLDLDKLCQNNIEQFKGESIQFFTSI